MQLKHKQHKQAQRKLSRPSNKHLQRGIIFVALLSLLPVLAVWLQQANPYFLNFRILKLSVYALTMLLPALIELFISALFRIRISELGFYSIVYLFYLFNFLIAWHIYSRQKSHKQKKRFFIWAVVFVIAYLTISLLLLW